ncbi:uncharacterized MFS-type transporter C09D4.1-like, partial [Stegodyphus dumicola]|uniref:uncharacterized MFS-type transporter C09D4.1-like n=1 Tax=Stegodyphus dumicola TaxID=202533 RepID=UPI0015AAF03F
MSNCEPKKAAEPQTTCENETLDIKVYKRRFWMLLLFCILSLLCDMMYPIYTGIASVTECYYNVSQEAVNWTSLLMNVVYVIFFFPVSIFIHKMGLRKSVLCISVLNTVASACQFATLNPNRFTYAIVSMLFTYLSSVFIHSLPPFIAAVWFPSNEVSRACAVGIFGSQ